MYTPTIKLKHVDEDRIVVVTESGSVCELGRQDWLAPIYELTVPCYWFERIKTMVEGRGDGTLLMQELVKMLDERGFAVVCGLNPYGGGKDLPRLTRFYQRYGFELVERTIAIRRPQCHQ